MLNKQEIKGIRGHLVNALFIILFTVFRVILLPFLIYKIYLTGNEQWEKFSTLQTICYLYFAFISVLIVLMNYYWYYKVLVILAKMIGCIKKP